MVVRIELLDLQDDTFQPTNPALEVLLSTTIARAEKFFRRDHNFDDIETMIKELDRRDFWVVPENRDIPLEELLEEGQPIICEVLGISLPVTFPVIAWIKVFVSDDEDLSPLSTEQ